jgi:glucokinase
MSEAAARVIALDVGGTSVKSGIVAAGGVVIGPAVLTPLDSLGRAEVVLDALAAIVRGHLPSAGGQSLAGLAIGFPSPFDYDTGVCRIRNQNKFDALYGVNVRDALRSRVPCDLAPIVFRNDAEAAIVGEARYGAGRPYTRLVGVTLGTGLGSAFVVEGQPVKIPEEEWLYRKPFHGIRADDWFSRRGIEARLVALGAPPDVRAAAEAARAGDARIRGVFTDLGGELASFLGPFVDAFGAEVVLVMGRIAGAFDLFGPGLSKGLGVLALLTERPDEAALLGAAELLLNPTRVASPGDYFR